MNNIYDDTKIRDKGGIRWQQLEACTSSAWRLSLSQHTWSMYSCSCTSITYKTTQTGELKHLATCCKFSNQVEEILQGWLVCGIHRTYSGICWWRQLWPEIAAGMEAAEKTTQHLKRPDSSVQQVVKANGVQTAKVSRQTQCYWYASTKHAAASYKFKEVTCHSYQK